MDQSERSWEQPPVLPDRVQPAIDRLHRNRELIVFSTILYSGAAVIGLLLTVVSTPIDPGVEPATSSVHVLMDGQSLFIKILSNNALVWGLLVVGGILFAIPTILNILFNGLLFGITLSIGFEVGPIPLALLILPHGIVEIPALLIATTAGLKIPWEFTRYIRGKKSHILFRQDVKDTLFLGLVSAICILIAAVIESTITIWLVESFTEYTIPK